MNNEKVILISIDGMRPDGFLKCKNPYIHERLKNSYHTLDAKTTLPTVTLPCHMSLFHSTEPARHGVTTNVYTPMVRPIDGLFEVLARAGKTSAFYYGWEPIRDVARPLSCKYTEYIHSYAEESTDDALTDAAISRIKKSRPDFVFLYLVETDEKGGHDNGWMTEEYLSVVSRAIDNVKRVIEAYGDEYTIIITADHGGHDRAHGLDIPEDRLIPNFYIGKMFEKNKTFSGGSILDIAPTIATIMDVPPSNEWEGVSVI